MKQSPVISVIIPTLNEEDFIRHTVETISFQKSNTTIIEIIVVDAGSTDQTISILEECPGINTILQEPSFKGKKYLSLNLGAKQASAEVFLFIDADSHVHLHFDKAIIEAINAEYIGGAFHMKHDISNITLRTIEKINTLRYRFSKWFYGDQGVFCTKTSFETVNGYPPFDIMESSFFCKSLKHHGKLKLLPQYITSSSRRFYKHGILKTFLLAFFIWFKCMIRLSTSKQATKYWNG